MLSSRLRYCIVFVSSGAILVLDGLPRLRRMRAAM